MELKSLKLRAHHVPWLHELERGCMRPLMIKEELPDFRADFREFLLKLGEHEDMPVEIVEGYDDICRACSHYKEHVGCTHPEEIDIPKERAKEVDRNISLKYHLDRIHTLRDLFEGVWRNGI